MTLCDELDGRTWSVRAGPRSASAAPPLLHRAMIRSDALHSGTRLGRSWARSGGSSASLAPSTTESLPFTRLAMLSGSMQQSPPQYQIGTNQPD